MLTQDVMTYRMQYSKSAETLPLSVGTASYCKCAGAPAGTMKGFHVTLSLFGYSTNYTPHRYYSNNTVVYNEEHSPRQAALSQAAPTQLRLLILFAIYPQACLLMR